MKPRNFPTRKLRRQIIAQGRPVKMHEGQFMTENQDDLDALNRARETRTKKYRSTR